MTKSNATSASTRKSGYTGQGGFVTLNCAVEEDLARIATGLARVLIPGDVVFLLGGLGAGKTTLARYLAQALGVGEDQYVSSPTFALLHEYRGHLPVYHMDCYRLNDQADVEDAGLMEFLELDGVTIIEWPERLGSLAPCNRLDVHIIVDPEGSRKVILTPYGPIWQARMAQVVHLLH